MSTVPAALNPTAPQSRLTAKADQEAARERFEGAFGIVRDELFAHFAAHGLPADAVEWYSRVSSLRSSLSFHGVELLSLHRY